MTGWRSERTTLETAVRVEVAPGPGAIMVDTGWPFIDHLLCAFMHHAGWSGQITCTGQVDPDGHHAAEDVGITLGQAIAAGVAAMPGHRRYGSALVPMDDALARAVIDLGGRPHFVFQLPGPCPVPDPGWGWDSVRALWEGFARASQSTVHLAGLYGDSAHHLAEAMAKALGMATGRAVEPADGPRSTKGTLA